LTPAISTNAASAMAVAAALVAASGQTQFSSGPSLNTQYIASSESGFNKQNTNHKSERSKNQNKSTSDKLNNSVLSKNSPDKIIAHKRHYCELCHKRFATEGVIRQHQPCSKQNNASFLRNNEGSLILKIINSNLTISSNTTNLK
jgi:hypothetical protein